jgi:DNA polymerase III alpha subunit
MPFQKSGRLGARCATNRCRCSAAASARAGETVPEIAEPIVALRPMTTGGEVVENYWHVGLTLRSHPVSFLREELRRKRVVTCAEAMQTRNGRWVEVAGLVLMRQRPGTAKGVTFVTIEDESGIANLIVWPKLYEHERRIILSARMLGIRGRVQREGEIVHIIAHWLTEMSGSLARIGAVETCNHPHDPRTYAPTSPPSALLGARSHCGVGASARHEQHTDRSARQRERLQER